LLARDVMVPSPIVVAAGATSAEVASLMKMKNISVAPVVDNPKDLGYLGTISDRDIVTRCVAAGHDPTRCSARQHVRTDTAVIGPDQELEGFHVRKYLDPGDSHVRSTVVVVDDKRVVGFIPHPEDVGGIVIIR
jgi:predicted transcriptional regulator